MNSKSKKGNVAFSTVIVTSSILLVAGAALLLSITDFSRSSKNYFNNSVNEIQSKACLEEALQKIKTDINYIGTFNISLNQGNCSIQIVTNSTNRDITITSTYNSYQLIYKKRVDISQNPYVLSNF